MLSIRRFLIIVSVAVITLVNFFAALQGYRTGLESTDQLSDQKLVKKARIVHSLLINSTATSAVTGDIPDTLLFQQFDSHGKLMNRSADTPERPLVKLQQGFETFSYNGHLWRSYTAVKTDAGFLMIAEQLDHRYLLTEKIILKTITPILLSLPLLSLLIWLIIGQGLKPLQRLTTAVAAKRQQDLTPIHESHLPEELQPLLTSMNDLLNRLQASFDREKRFSGDAAHELRTPLSALKINLYNLEKQYAGDENVAEMALSVERMAQLIEQMLMLYRLSPEQLQSNFIKVNLEAVAQQVISDCYHAIDTRQQEISQQVEGDVTLEGDVLALQVLIKNLVDNASKYTPNNGKIALTLQGNDADVVLVLEDSGEGIPDAMMDRALERFYRVNGDQHHSKVTGAGLGLSIVQHIVTLHQGALCMAHSSFDTGLRVTVRLPRSQENPDA